MCVFALTRELQTGVSRGVAHTRRRVSSVGHVGLRALGLAVDHGQAQTQALSVGLGPGHKQTQHTHCKQHPASNKAHTAAMLRPLKCYFNTEVMIRFSHRYLLAADGDFATMMAFL